MNAKRKQKHIQRLLKKAAEDWAKLYETDEEFRMFVNPDSFFISKGEMSHSINPQITINNG